jgi:hypothetical protein
MDDPSYGVVEPWKKAWATSKTLNYVLVSQLEQRLSGFQLPRK